MKDRTVLAKHTRHKSPKPFTQILVFLGSVIGVLALTASSIAAFTVWDSYQRYAGNSVDLSSVTDYVAPPTFSFEPYGEDVTFLLVGTDECEEAFSQYFGGRCDGSESGARNDVTLLVRVPADHSQATVISFPRDLMVDFPECGAKSGARIKASSYQQLNSSYDRGGLGCVADVVEELSGFEIPFAAKISWGGVITVTDALGGVNVCVNNGIYDRHTGLSLAPGTHTLQGLPALQFLRTRHGLSDGSDLARISNQQLYMSALLKKVTSEGTLNSPLQMLELSKVIVDNLEHSSSLNDPNTLISLALLLKEIPLDKISFVQVPAVTDPSNPNRVVPDDYRWDDFWVSVRGEKNLVLEHNQNGAVAEEVVAKPIDETKESVSAPGVDASMNLCANGAG